jgi:hypothetical protein
MSATPTAAAPHHHPDTSPQAANGRDGKGCFAEGNPGGPGNPFYRRQAQLKRRMLECVTEEDMQAVMQVLMGLVRGGNLAAVKLYLAYTVGKPTKEVDPDKEELHEWQLQQQTPRLEQVLDVSANGIEPPRANQVTSDLVKIMGDCHLKTVGKVLKDGTDYHGNYYGPPLDEVAPPPPQPDRSNGGKRPAAHAQHMAAGVQPTDQTGDNGQGPTLDELLAEVVRTVHSVENGPERATRSWYQPEPGTKHPGRVDHR